MYGDKRPKLPVANTTAAEAVFLKKKLLQKLLLLCQELVAFCSL